MSALGRYFRESREQLQLPLQDVYQQTNIDIAQLSRIENGRRLPTKEQFNTLVQIYGCDEHKSLVLLGAEKVLLTLGNDTEYNTEVMTSILERIKEGYVSPDSENETANYSKTFELESRRYIGNKAKLTDWILNIINEHTGGFESFFDVFAGTASVSKAAIPYAKKIIMNDFLASNNIIYKAFFSKDYYNTTLLNNILQQYNSINPDTLPDNYFSLNFGNKFFDYKNAKLIGYIREDLEIKSQTLFISPKEYAMLLTSLIYSMDKIANTVGHFDAYIKKSIEYRPLRMQMINPLHPLDVEIHQEDANKLVTNIQADVAYIDPPYNSRQYSRFYHIYENLVKWEKPELYGVAMKPKAENMSAYCTTSAAKAFCDLVMHLNVKYIAVSYNNTYDSKSGSSKNKITLEEIKDILEKRGSTQVYDCSHRCFNTGKTEFADHKELLFITKVEK